jgi:hypothetical protein
MYKSTLVKSNSNDNMYCLGFIALTLDTYLFRHLFLKLANSRPTKVEKSQMTLQINFVNISVGKIFLMFNN